MNKNNLTPFEQFMLKKDESIKRLAGFLIMSAWLQRIRQLRLQNKTMKPMEAAEWDHVIQAAMVAQFKYFGYDA